MVKRVQRVRHTTANADAFTGLEGEITVDTDRKDLRIHDGVISGGKRLPNKDALDTLYYTITLVKFDYTGNVITFNKDQSASIDFLIKASGVASAFSVLGADGSASFGATLGVTGLLTATGNIAVNVISERTAAAGVTIDGLLIKDSIATGHLQASLNLSDVATPATALSNIGGAALVHTHVLADITNAGSAAAEAAAAGTGALARDNVVAKLAGGQQLTGGFDEAEHDLGTRATGTETLTFVGGNRKKIINGGAFTLAAPTATGSMIVQLTNNAAAGTLTITGVDEQTGETIGTTNLDVYKLFFDISSSFKTLHVRKK